MDLMVADCAVVNYCQVSTRGNMHNLSAKYNNEIFSVWIKRSNFIPMQATFRNFGYEWRGSELYRYGKKKPTVSLNTALRMFHEFLKKPARKVILVGHSSDVDLMSLLRAIRSTNTSHMFRDTIAGFADTVLILRNKYRDRKQALQFSLPNLSRDLLGKVLITEIGQESTILDAMQDLTSKLTIESDYEGYIVPYDEAVETEDVQELY